MKRARTHYCIRTAVRVMGVLEALNEELSVTQVSRKVPLTKNNAFRILVTLVDLGYVEQNPETEAYRRGPKCAQLARTTVIGGLAAALDEMEGAVARARCLISKEEANA